MLAFAIFMPAPTALENFEVFLVGLDTAGLPAIGKPSDLARISTPDAKRSACSINSSPTLNGILSSCLIIRSANARPGVARAIGPAAVAPIRVAMPGPPKALVP